VIRTNNIPTLYAFYIAPFTNHLPTYFALVLWLFAKTFHNINELYHDTERMSSIL